MKYDRVLLISVDSLAKKYESFFKDYFTTIYTNYKTTSSWTLPSHLTMLTGLKFPKLFFQKKTIDYLKYEDFVQNIPSIATQMKAIGFKSRAITGGGFMGKFFGWGHDWNKWIEAYSEKEAWNGEKIVPKKYEFLFLHTYYIHNWFIKNKKINKSFNKIKTQLENKKEYDKKEYEYVVKFAKNEYEKRIKTMAKRLSWISKLPKNILVILTSDHAELFSKQGAFHHGSLATETSEIFSVPLLLKENTSTKKIDNGYMFDFLLPKLIFDKLEAQFKSIPRMLIEDNKKMKSELNKIHNSKTWKLLYFYKNITSSLGSSAISIVNIYWNISQKISIRKILKLIHLS